jgi:lysophospholipase L1-like esterase
MKRSLFCFLLVLHAASPARAAEKFELRDGDRVVLLGSTLVEREQRYGHWEAALTARFPDRGIIFRNLGWSGDTVFAESRGVFDPPEKGFQRLVEGVKGLRPTVLMVAYGTNESFDGEPGLPRFVRGLEHLLDALAPTRARVVLLSPPPMENLGPPLPDPADQNRNLERYADAIRKVAEKRKHTFVDLFRLFRDAGKGRPLTDNGMHLTEDGYRRTAPLLLKGLGLGAGPGAEPGDRLRAVIVEKNRLYFHRWRPQNETYLFGFRKHEQGQNAREVPLFDPLVAAKEKEIARLRAAAPRRDRPAPEPKTEK